LVDYGGKHRGADRTAEVAEHVADARCRRCILRGDAPVITEVSGS